MDPYTKYYYNLFKIGMAIFVILLIIFVVFECIRDWR